MTSVAQAEDTPRVLQIMAGSAAETGDSLKRLHALVLLAGSVRPGRLAWETGRSVLDLPLDRGRSLLSQWVEAASGLCGLVGLEALPIRVLVNHKMPRPESLPSETFPTMVQIEDDPSAFRGTGGLLRDLTLDYPDEAYILVASAAQILLEPLEKLAEALAADQADVSMTAHRDGTPGGVMLIRCAALRQIAPEGFVDLKEQALATIAASHRVMVVPRPWSSSLPMRTHEEYVAGLRDYHRQKSGELWSEDPFDEDWRAHFSVIEPGAQVHPEARIHDSVVLHGGIVEAGAMVVRSVICPGGVVRPGKRVLDQVVTAAGSHRRTRRR